jgi:glutaminyl-peptide cyclotransferase
MAQHATSGGEGTSAVKVIVVLGVIAFVLLLILAAGIRQLTNRDESQAVGEVKAQSPFDGQRAYADLETVVGFGPRPSGSEALERLRDFIRGELSAAGLEVREHAFTGQTPLGPIGMVNLYGVVEGDKPGVIILSNHYETKYFPDFEFVGANDGGSTTAWMLEMARTLGPTRSGRTIWLTFFDGEEAFADWSKTDSLYGSRAFVQRLQETGEFEQLAAVINVDMIGDCYLGINRDPDAPHWLIGPLWNTASELGYERHFQRSGRAIEDDHIPFREAGASAVNLIDFSYGGTMLDHQRNWHTPRDTLDLCCAGSLQVVGDVIYHALPELEAQLDARVMK